MDTLATLLFYLIGLIAFLIVAWLIEGLYFWITGRDEPVERIKIDYRRDRK